MRVIEGTWDEIKRHEAELAGRYLRVTITSKRPSKSRHAPVKSSVMKKRQDALDAWLSLPRPIVSHDVDDSRGGIYGDSEDGR
jgi:hypothetical protein